MASFLSVIGGARQGFCTDIMRSSRSPQIRSSSPQLGQNTNDMSSFVSMMYASEHVAAMLHTQTGLAEHLVGVVLADAGYCSDRNLAAPEPDRLIALTKGRNQAKAAQHESATGPPPHAAIPRQAMDHRLRTAEGSALYKRRRATVEPGIGNLKNSPTGSPAAAWTMHSASSTSPPARST